jgi:M6 family metalloprotease-like protein
MSRSGAMNAGKMTSTPARIAAAVLIAGVSLAMALEPPTREQVERYRKDGTLAARVAQAKSFGNHRLAPRLVSRLREKIVPKAVSGRSASGVSPRAVERIALPPPAWVGLPTKGTVKVLALLIAFSDDPPVTPADTIASRLFGDGQGGAPFDSLRNYYRRSSYDQLEIQGNVLGWYTTPYARSTVTQTDAGREAVIKEALSYYDQQGHDFSQYDNNGDGAIDYFCVFWTGPHGEWASFWWGYYTGFSDSSFRLDGKRLSQYSWQWELYGYPAGNFSPQTIIHETGHALGVPDYYDYDDSVGPGGGVGGLDIMDGTVGDHNCFSKFMLDWISPTVAPSGPQSVTLRASGLYGDALLFIPGAVPGKIFDEYFMVQNRQRVGNDTGLFTASDGLLVWHVDARLNGSGWDYLYDNSYTAHKLLKLMEADGLEEIEKYGSPADAGDYYQAGMSFGPTGTPNTDRYDGTPTAMGITDIVGATSPISLDVFAGDLPPTCAITNLTDGQTIYGTVEIDATASDDVGIQRVEFFADGVLLGTLASAPYSFTLDTKTLYNGTHTLSVVAYDQVLQTATASVSVTVENYYAPVNVTGQKVLNRSALLKEYINVLTWKDDPRNATDSKFRVYLVSGGQKQLLAEVTRDKNLGPYTYLHRNVNGSQTYTYKIAAVDAGDREGDSAAVTVR